MNSKGKGKTWIFAAAFLLASFGVAAAQEGAPTAATTEAVQVEAVDAQAAAAPVTESTTPPETAAPSEVAGALVSVEIDGSNTIDNGGVIKVKGQAPAGKPVFLEVWAESHSVRANRFDKDPDPQTGVRPYIFYLTEHMPAYFKIFAPTTMQDKIDAEKKKGNKWSMSNIIKELGAESAFNVPAEVPIKAYQSSFVASIIGSRGELLSDAPDRRRSMQLTKARFRDLDKVVGAQIDLQQDGSFTAEIPMRSGIAPGEYTIVAHVDQGTKSAPITFTNTTNFPTVYLTNAGTSMNLIYPFILTLAVTMFGVLMGAGGGFILNPLLVTLFPMLPHTIVAGTVTPTVLFSQGSGIYNYSRINFISWKLGIGIGLAMLAGGFIGPKLTEMITLAQFKSAFGWILLILAGLMFWQTTPGYLASNKKEQAILKEFKKRAEDAAAKK